MPTRTFDLGSTQVNCRIEGDGLTILLVHGFPLDHTMWEGQFDALAAHYRVVAPDLPGFGQSAPIDGTYLMSTFADDLGKLVDSLDVAEPIVFCGLSMGGYIGWEFWRRHREKLLGLIVCDSRAIADDDVVQKGRDVAASRVLAEGVQVVSDSMLPRLFAESFCERSSRQVDRTKAVMEATPASTVAAALRGMARRDDFSPLLPTIDLPALIICGQHDAISTPDEMQDIATALPHAAYLEIAGAGHMAPMERPTSVNNAVLDFMAQLTTTQS